MKWARQKQTGFTIVELLIVVVVIAILAAITIVAYNGITNRAKQSAVASLATQVQKKLSIYAAVNNDQYPATLADAEVDAATASNVQYSYNNTSNPKGFCVTATQNSLSSYVAKSYSYTSGTPQVVEQSNPTAGACPGHAPAGTPQSNNLVMNPASRVNPTGYATVSSTGGLPVGTRVTSVSGLSSLGITTAYRNTLGGTPGSWWRVQYDPNPVITEGESYVLSGYIRTSVTASTTVIIIWENSVGGTVSESAGTLTSQAAGTWARRSVIGAAPAGAVSARLHFSAANNGVAGAYIDATAIMFHAGSTLYGYADGSSTNWVWEGTADASTSKGPAV